MSDAARTHSQRSNQRSGGNVVSDSPHPATGSDPDSEPSLDEASSSGGCCSWLFGAKKKKPAQKYKTNQPVDAASTPSSAKAKPSSASGVKDGTELSSLASAKSSSNAPQVTKSSEQGSIQQSPASPSSTTSAQLAHQSFCSDWNELIAALRSQSPAASDNPSTNIDCPILLAWIDSLRLGSIHRALATRATSRASRVPAESTIIATGAGGTSRHSPSQSADFQQMQPSSLLLQNGVPPLVFAGSNIPNASPPATLRWTRRQTMRTQRELEAHQQMNGGVSSHQANPLIERQLSVEFSRHSSLINDGDETNRVSVLAAAGQADEALILQSPTASAPTNNSLISLPLDLSSAQALNEQLQQREAILASQQQQQVQFQEEPTATTAGGPVAIDREVFHGLNDFSAAIGRQLVLNHLPNLGAELLSTATSSQQSPSTSKQQATASLSSMSANGSFEYISSADVMRWVYALVSLSQQICSSSSSLSGATSTTAKSKSQSLFNKLFQAPQSLPPTSFQIENPEKIAAAHLATLLAFTMPLVNYYGSEASQMLNCTPFFTSEDSASSNLIAVFPPQESLSKLFSNPSNNIAMQLLLPTYVPVESSAVLVSRIESELVKQMSGLIQAAHGGGGGGTSSAAPTFRSGSSALTVGTTSHALMKLRLLLQWTKESHESILFTANASDSTAFTSLFLQAYPYLLQALLDLFWTNLSVAQVVDTNEAIMLALWKDWYTSIDIILQQWSTLIHQEEKTRSSTEMLVKAMRYPIEYNSASAVISASVPSLVQLVSTTSTLLFDPLSHPLELTSPPTPSLCIPHAQQAVVHTLSKLAAFLSSPPALVSVQALAAQLEQQQQQENNSILQSPLLALSWFWDALLPLFGPSEGLLYQFLRNGSSSLESDVHEAEEDDAEVSSATSSAHQMVMKSLVRRIEISICEFLSSFVFATPAEQSRPYICPWIMDDSFTATYLQLHFTAVCEQFNALPLKRSKRTASDLSEQLCLAHTHVLTAAASIPTQVNMRSVSTPHGAFARSQVRLIHIHFQLYHLGILAWISAQTNLEHEFGIEPPLLVAKHDDGDGAIAEGMGGVDSQRSNKEDSTHDQNESKTNHPDNAERKTSLGGSKGDEKEKQGEESSVFSDINFEDSDDEYTEPTAAAAPSAFKLAIVQGDMHLNERFALGMDGKPLHPNFQQMDQSLYAFSPEQPITNAAEQQKNLPTEKEASVSGSTSDLGSEGWGDSYDSLPGTPRTGGLALALPLQASSQAETNDAVQPQETQLTETVNEATADGAFSGGNGAVGFAADPDLAIGAIRPDGNAAATSYQEIRSTHPVYRSEQVHAALVGLLLQLCIDPSSEGCNALNPLYCTRFPLQPTAEEQALAERMQRLNETTNAAAPAVTETSGSVSASQSLEESQMPISLLSDRVPPLGINVIYALHRHLNHPDNGYLISNILHDHQAQQLSLNGNASSECDGGDYHTNRRRAMKRLMKLLFQQLFDTSCFSHRVQIGRGRFASVFRTNYAPKSRDNALSSSSSFFEQHRVPDPKARYALKQVELPSGIYDQVSLVDLFTEISILECLERDTILNVDDNHSAAASSIIDGGVLKLIDYGVGENCFWIVMPLATQSLKALKRAQMDVELTQQSQMKNQASSTLTQTDMDDLAHSLFASLYEPSSIQQLEKHWSSIAIAEKRLLANLSLYQQVLNAAHALERHHVVHFDIKAENVLMFRRADGSSEVSGPRTNKCRLQAVLADFGEAMFITDEASPFSLIGASSQGSQISRGTENIQSPEMLTLIRALDRHYEHHDRRRKHEADVASDVWSIGAMFYELCMHSYPASNAPAASSSTDEAIAHGTGLLFEEEAGLPLFLQITAESIPVLSDDKAMFLSDSSQLGRLLPECCDFLEFVLRKDRLQRPNLDQVHAKFKQTITDILQVCFGREEKIDFKPLPLAEVNSPCAATAAEGAKIESTSALAAPDSSECDCNAIARNWQGVVPSSWSKRCVRHQQETKRKRLPNFVNQSVYSASGETLLSSNINSLLSAEKIHCPSVQLIQNDADLFGSILSVSSVQSSCVVIYSSSASMNTEEYQARFAASFANHRIFFLPIDTQSEGDLVKFEGLDGKLLAVRKELLTEAISFLANCPQSAQNSTGTIIAEQSFAPLVLHIIDCHLQKVYGDRSVIQLDAISRALRMQFSVSANS